MSGETILVIDDSPTILRVVELVLVKAGYRVHTTLSGDAGVRMALELRPQLILLDFVMPKMNGYQVCRALSDSSELKSIPVVLMSSRGEHVGARFVEVMGVVDYITKPFSPGPLTDVIARALAASRMPKQAEPPALERGATEPLAIAPPDSIEETPAGGLPSPSDVRRMDALAGLREALIAALGTPGGETDWAAQVQRLDEATLERLIEPVARILARDSETAALSGELGQVPIAQVLGLLKQQEQWGVLTTIRQTAQPATTAKVEIFFRHGKIDLALTEPKTDELLVGRFLIDEESLPRTVFDRFIESRADSPHPIGEQLVRLGYVTQPQLKQGLERQTRERIYELLKWPTGHFSFVVTRELPPLATAAALALDVDGILMEGFRRVDEWHLIEREVDDFDAVYLRNEEVVENLGKARLTREELTVLELVTGRNTIKDIVRSSRMGSFEVSKMIFRLHHINLIRRRVSPVAV